MHQCQISIKRTSFLCAWCWSVALCLMMWILDSFISNFDTTKLTFFKILLRSCSLASLILNHVSFLPSLTIHSGLLQPPLIQCTQVSYNHLEVCSCITPQSHYHTSQWYDLTSYYMFLECVIQPYEDMISYHTSTRIWYHLISYNPNPLWCVLQPSYDVISYHILR